MRLERHRPFPGPFALVTPESLAAGKLRELPGTATIAQAALAMARISLHRSLPDQARAFTQVGLDDLANTPGGGGYGIQRRLMEIKKALETSG